MRKMLDKIIEKNNRKDMDELGEIFMRLVKEKKETSAMEYKEIVYTMHKMAYGDHLTEHEAHCWVGWMKNKDGTTGGHWTFEQTESVRKQYFSTADPYDYFAVLNMIYSDYYNPKFDISEYATMAKDFIEDKDGGYCKTLKYYLFIAKD